MIDRTTHIVKFFIRKNYKIFFKNLNLHYSLVRWHQHLQITLRAIEQLKKIAEPGEYLRINVDSGGCAGFEYKILLDKRFNKDEDEIIEKDGVKIVVDKISLNFIKGFQIGFYAGANAKCFPYYRQSTIHPRLLMWLQFCSKVYVNLVALYKINTVCK